MRRLGLLTLAVLLLLPASAPSAWAFERVGPWSFGSWYGVGVPDAADINEQVDLANLAFSSNITSFETDHEASGDLRRDLSEKWAAEARAGYWWKRRGEGLYTRRISAIPLEAGLIYTTFSSRRARAGFTAAGGALLSATLAGEDPLGGVDHSGTGVIGELGVTGEFSISPAWSVQGRFVGRYAVAKDVLPDHGDLDFSGISGQLGLRVSFDTRSQSDSTSTEKK